MNEESVNRLSGRAVLALSVFSMLLVLGATVLTMLGRFSPSPDGDEGAAARLFQLAIVLLLPAGLAFLATADWRTPVNVVKRLVVPAVALAVAFSTLFYWDKCGNPAFQASLGQRARIHLEVLETHEDAVLHGYESGWIHRNRG